MAQSNPLYQPYAEVHKKPQGPGDKRPTALQVIQDSGAVGKFSGKTVLITGTSSGIGVETARALYEAGATLFLTARDLPKLEKVIDDIVSNASHNKEGPRPVPIEVHLDSLKSVRKGVETFKSKSGGKLNILINNAGVMAAPFAKTKDGFELQVGTNHLAHFLLFQLVKPLLLESAKESGTASKVINVSSTGHRFGTVRLDDLNYTQDPTAYNEWAAYGSSKTANIWMTNYITRHYTSQNLIGLALHPGGIQTELYRHLSPENTEGIDMEGFAPLFKSPAQGAATTIWAAVNRHFEGRNGGQYLADVGETAEDPEGLGIEGSGHVRHAFDEEGEERLWKLSNELVGVEDE